MAVLFISSEMEEVVRVSDRIVVLRDRSKVGELPAGSSDPGGLRHDCGAGMSTTAPSLWTRMRAHSLFWPLVTLLLILIGQRQPEPRLLEAAVA